MKFPISLVIGTLAFGMLAAVGPAEAAPQVSGVAAAADPYPRTVRTVCDARRLKNPYRAGKKEQFRMTIIENSTDLPRVRLSYIKQRKLANGKWKTVRVYRAKRYYHGKPLNLPMQSTRNGLYRVIVKTNFGPKSQFRNCRDSIVFRVAGASPLPGNGNNNGNGNGNGNNNGNGNEGPGQLPATGSKHDD